MSEYVWGVRMEDDVTARAQAMANSVEDLRDDVRSLASSFAVTQSATKTLNLNLDTARKLFKDGGGNVKLFRAALKDAGISALDTSILVGKMTKELHAERRAILGVTAEENEHVAAMKRAQEARKKELELIKQQAKAEKERIKAAEKARKESERRDRMGLLERMGVTPHKIWVLSHSMNVISKSISAVGTIGGAVKNVIGGIADTAANVGKGLFDSVVDAAQFRQNALTGLEYLLGSREEAEGMFKYAQKFAQDTPLDTDKVITGLKQLVTQGFSGDEAKLLYKAVADQQAKFMDDAGMQDKVIAAFSRVQGRGVATGEDLESFLVAGFRSEGIIEQLLQNQGLSPLWDKVKRTGLDGAKTSFVSQDKATQEEILKEVKSALGEGKIGKYTFMNAALRSLEKDKPNLGEFAKMSGRNSLTGTLSNFKALWGDLLKSVNIQDWPGIRSLQRFMARVVDLFSAGSPAATRLLGIVENVFNSMTSGLDAIGEEDIMSFLGKIETFSKSVVRFIKEAWDWVDRLLHMDSGSIADSMIDAVVLVGKYLGAAIWEGVKAGGSLLEDRKMAKQGVSDLGLFRQAFKQGRSEEDVKKEFMGRYSAFKAAGLKVPEAKGFQNKDDLLYDTVTRFGVEKERQEAISQFNEIFPPLTGQVSKEMYNLGSQAAWSVKTGWQEALDQHSPSRVLMALGAQAGESLVSGLEKSGMGEGGAGGGVTVGSINININALSSDPTALREAIREPLTAEVIQIFEQIGRTG